MVRLVHIEKTQENPNVDPTYAVIDAGAVRFRPMVLTAAAVAAGAYPDIRSAAAAMGKSNRGVYQPNESDAKVYDRIYAEYELLHDHFGRGANDAMKRLKALKREVSK